MRMKRILPLLFALSTFLSCTAVPSLTEQDRSLLKQDIEDLIQEQIDQAGITGLAGAVVYKGNVLTARGYGLKGNAMPVQEETLFRIGSVSKTLTALAVMQLAEEGLIDLDADIRRYIKDFNPKSLSEEDRPVSIRDLLTHHSGIPSLYLKDFELESCNPDYFMRTSALLSEEYLTWKSGKVYAYNNTAFSLLGELISTVSGMSYKEYIEQNIFLPSGMADAQVYLEDLQDPQVSGGFTKGDILYIRDIPAGSILFSSQDMGAYMKELLACSREESDALLKTATLRSMFVRQNEGIPLDSDFEIGLCFFLRDFHHHRVVEHQGTIPPYYTSMILLPEEGLGVFLSSNDHVGDNAIIESMAEEILTALLGSSIETREEPSPVTNGNPEPLDLQEMAGYYNAANLGLMQIVSRDSHLQLELPGMGISAEMMIEGDGTLSVEEAALRFVPSSSIGFFGYSDKFFTGSVTPVETYALPARWKPRLGQYVQEETTASEWTFDGAILSYDPETRAMILEATLMGEKMINAVTPLSATLLQVQGYGRNQGNVIEFDGTGPVDVLTYAGIRFIRQE